MKEAIVNGHHEIIREVIKFLIEYEKQCIKEKKKYDRDIRHGREPIISPQPIPFGIHAKQNN